MTDEAAAATAEPPVRAADLPLAALRGVGQVEFQPNPWTAVVFLVALAVGGWQFAVFGALGAAAGTVAAWALGARRTGLLAGLEGFNGALIGVALVLYFDVRWFTVLLVVAGAVVGSVLSAALAAWLAPYGLPTFTAPFCTVTTLMVVAAPSYERIWQGSSLAVPPSTADPSPHLTFTDVWHGLLNGIGQVFLQDQWYVGLIFLFGLLVAGPRVAAAAFGGSVLGLVSAWILGAPGADVAAGLYGYNAVLVAIALSGTFVVADRAGTLFAMLGAVTATGLTAAVTGLFAPVGGHTLTWPFVLVTWVFLGAVPAFARIRRAGEPAPQGGKP